MGKHLILTIVTEGDNPINYLEANEMKYKEFKDKKKAIEFIEKNGGYYEIVVDERANSTYIVFYR